MEFLLQHKSVLAVSDEEIVEIFPQATKNGNASIVRLLLQSSPNLVKRGSVKAVPTAAPAGHVEGFEAILEYLGVTKMVNRIMEPLLCSGQIILIQRGLSLGDKPKVLPCRMGLVSSTSILYTVVPSLLLWKAVYPPVSRRLEVLKWRMD